MERAFEVGDHVRVAESLFGSGPASLGGTTGIVRSIDRGRRRTAPYYIYSIELPGEETWVEFEYRELELVSLANDSFNVKEEKRFE